MVDPLKCHRFESRSSWRRNFLTAGRVWLAIEYHRRSSIRTALTLTEAGDDANFNLNLGIGGEKWAWAGRHRLDDSAFPQGLEIDYVCIHQNAQRAKDRRQTL